MDTNHVPNGTTNEAAKARKTGHLAPSNIIFSAFGNTKKVIIFRIMGIIFAMASGAVYPCMIFYFAKSFENIGAQSSDEKYLSNVRNMVFTIMVVGSIGFLFLVLQATFLEVSAAEAAQDFEIKWFNALLRQDMAYFDIKDISAEATIISSNAAQFKKGIGRKLGEGVQFSCFFLGSFIYAFYVSWKVSLLLLTTIPFVAGSALFMMTVTTKHTERISKNYAIPRGIVYGTISSIRTVFSLNAAEIMITKFKAATSKAYDSAVRFNALVGLGNGLMKGSFLVPNMVVTLYGSFLLYSQVRTGGCDPSNTLESLSGYDSAESCSTVGADVFGASIGISFGAMSLAQISNAVEAFIQTRASAYFALEAIQRTFDTNINENDTLEAVETPPDNIVPNSLKRSEIPLPKYVIDSTSCFGVKPNFVKGDISFKNVTFSYPTRREQIIFNGLSLKIKAGSTVAIVGTSGCGKSTIISLLERFYDVNFGSITLDGVDVREINVKWLRDHIGLVSQEPVLFARSIKENIAYGLPGATDEDIVRVSKLANAHDFISQFPRGYDTHVGDKGTQLSGGQKQRIAIARILLKNPKILLLDEATSALDSESEYLVQDAINDLLGKGSHTTIVIAHRLSTIRNCDVIAVIKDGQLAEMGTHMELMSKKSEYFKLVSAQMVDRSRSWSEIPLPTVLPSIRYDGEFTEAPHIEFKDVCFHYPTRPLNEIFKGLNLNIKRGETLAIIGPSGGGKSTLVQLIERFYDPISGTIFFDGHDLRDLNIKWYRDQIGLVSQEPSLFNTTVRENILYALPKATQAEVEEAARNADAHDFIMSFPSCYDTEVGESAIQISGGQKQRIAIARAILKRPKILLLDEATSALDAESERIVQNTIDYLMKAKKQTIIVIAHRLSTILNADRFAVIADGVVKEIGTSDQLMSVENGYFKRLTEFDIASANGMKITSLEEENMVKDDILKDISIIQSEENEQNQKEMERSHKMRARALSKPDTLYFLVGIFGAIFAGIVSPGRGVVFGYMIELLFHPVFPCDEFNLYVADTFEGFISCQEYFDHEADWIRDYSYKVTYGWLGLMVCSMIGNVLLYYGFGTATERMNKRVRDSIFVALMKQDIAYYDTHSIGSLSTQIEEDAAMIHSFSGEPIRTFVMSLSSVFVGLIISFSLMWPFALLTFVAIPFIGFGAFMERKMYTGDDTGAQSSKDGTWTSSGSIAIETLSNIRTVSSLCIEKNRSDEFLSALRRENELSFKMNLLKGLAVGAGFLAEFWSLGWMFFWGGYLISNYPKTYSFRSYLISMFSLFFSLTGLSAAFMGTTDKRKAKQAAERIFSLLDRKSPINSISDEGAKLAE